MSKLTITLPYPDAGLSPNARVHFRQKAELAKVAHETAYLTTLTTFYEMIDDGENIPMRITFHPPDARGRDLDNAYASLKATLDGIAQALGVNDKNFHPVTLDWGHQFKGGYVTVELLP